MPGKWNQEALLIFFFLMTSSRDLGLPSSLPGWQVSAISKWDDQFGLKTLYVVGLKMRIWEMILFGIWGRCWVGCHMTEASGWDRIDVELILDIFTLSSLYVHLVVFLHVTDPSRCLLLFSSRDSLLSVLPKNPVAVLPGALPITQLWTLLFTSPLLHLLLLPALLAISQLYLCSPASIHFRIFLW